MNLGKSADLILAKPFWFASVTPLRTLNVDVKARAEILEGLPVVHAHGIGKVIRDMGLIAVGSASARPCWLGEAC